MTRIAVTGGSGKLGRAVVTDLTEHGYDVVNLDRAGPPGGDRSYLRVDLTHYGQTVEALSAVDDRYDRVDGLVHLAAIPASGLTTNAATFANNVITSYNVFTVMTTPSAELAAQGFPGVEVRRELLGTRTLLSIDKARRVLGYDPQHSWRDHADPAT